MPPLVIFDRQGRVESLLPSSHMALGALSANEFEEDIFSLDFQRGQRVLCYTDGVTETSNGDGDMFGEERLIDALSAGISGQAAVEQLADALDAHAAGVALDDDATIFCLDTVLYTGFGDGTDLRANADYSQWNGFHWRTRMQFSAAQIGSEQPLDLFFSSLPAHPIVRAARADLSLIITELFVNALDHGLLDLDSSLKDQGEGLMQYFMLREQRLQKLQSGLIDIELSCRVEQGIGRFQIVCEDSGAGFDCAAALACVPDDTRHCGRGLQMLAAICESIESNAVGNQLSLQYRWPPAGRTR
jgi:anti-sigma regulatory factor (Ser/Thr protein kinase)